jgi:hypothetical protein
MYRRSKIPIQTKHAVITAIDRGDTRRAIRDTYQLKNYSNINRILDQRETLEDMLRRKNQLIDNMSELDDNDTYVSDDNDDTNMEVEDDGNEELPLIVIKQYLEKIKLGVQIMEGVQETLGDKLNLVLKKLKAADRSLEAADADLEDNADDSEAEEEEEGSTTQDGTGDEEEGEYIVRRRLRRLLVQIQILTDVAQTLDDNMSNVTSDTLKLAKAITGKPMESDSETNE